MVALSEDYHNSVLISTSFYTRRSSGLVSEKLVGFREVGLLGGQFWLKDVGLRNGPGNGVFKTFRFTISIAVIPSDQISDLES